MKSKLLSTALTVTDASRREIVGILAFARPDAEMKAGLRRIANSGGRADGALDAYQILFQLGLVDGEVRTEIVGKLSEYRYPAKASDARDLLFYAKTCVWPIPEAVPIYIEMLRNGDTTLKSDAALALLACGAAAESALPEMRKQMDALKAQGADFRRINDFERAIKGIEMSVGADQHG